ncbi:MAG TPA: DegT/DnrJ/EryC1/StrS family aminotransferase, partial [Xanthobacteraceae bacterium]|nr:DegT/DnrJ/EryC1/StrS family aminotransferase [Xanthobacteraceae bacterium]
MRTAPARKDAPPLLAIDGGEPLRKKPMPPRLALGDAEVAALEEAVAFYRERQIDPGYQGPLEQRYTEAFVRRMGGGYADAVATGTAALFVALAALELPPGSEVIVSPVTDPGAISAIILNRLVPRLADSAPGSYNMGPDEFVARLTSAVRAVVLVHSLGRPADVLGIVREAHARGIRVVEDCSQAHGARVKGRPVGAFGDIAAFSTMYRKAHMTGASGGVVYSRNLELYRRALAHADRGKPSWQDDFDDRNPNQFLFPALNLHTDELSCAVGLASLARLDDTILRRLTFVAEFSGRLLDRSRVCRPYGYTPNDSPFVYPVIVDVAAISCSKQRFAEAVRAEGIGLNVHYQYLVADWPWVKPHLADSFDPSNA